MDDSKPPPRKGTYARDLTYKELRRIAMSYAVKAGYPNEAEDFAQQFLIDLFQGRSLSLEYHFVDYMRANVAYVRSKKGHAKWAAQTTFASLKTKEVAWKADPTKINDDFLVKERLQGYDRVIILLSAVYGFGLKEIGDLFGVSEAHICYTLKLAYKAMRKKLKDVK